ncbi:MAG TPA: L-ribulose-5-phosphate 4-epimerase AraD [Vicinamibacterales bacterium]|nr:L-ribulose-5-phosphate 4-epimerase AraD [Vicinamibacterales bacterium]
MNLKERACRANLELAATGLVMGTFGNLSIADRAAGVFAIKPSGVPYGELKPDKIVLISLDTGKPLDERWKPSSDTPTHLELYRAFDCSAIVHTHSEFATLFAQTRTPIRCMGTTHADYFNGDIPVTRAMTRKEVENDYEANTGRVIVETFKKGSMSSVAIPAVLVANHAPFAWGPSAAKAIETAEILEFLARLEWRGRVMAPDAPAPEQYLIDKHFSRKHGKGAYYGQQ